VVLVELYQPQLAYGGKVFRPGVYSISNEEYHASVGISRSAIILAKQSPLHYWDAYLNPIKQKSKSKRSFQLGNAVHNYLLEPELFKEQYMIMPVFAGKGSKKAKEDFKKENKGKTFIKKSDLEIVEAIANVIDKHPTASHLIKDACYEKSIYWIDEESGLICKARPDIWHSNMIVDLKTTDCAEFNSFKSSITNYGYYIQAAMCLDAISAIALEEHNNFLFVAVETERPHAAVSYQLKEEAIQQGRHDYKKELLNLKPCFEADKWPGYEDQEISIKRYALTI
jgi:hypothetical protein